ncbi:MAG TPA: hypothetical protein VKH18_00985 [Terriglobales bacterium]|nr:hypothetical protein [Terriglobales bacterium]
MSLMRFCGGLIFVAILLAGCVFGQDSASASTSTHNSAPTAAASRTADLKPIDLKPIDLTPDATGTVPAEQIREILRRAGEKDLENDKQQHDYTYVEREEQHHLDGHGGVKKIESRTSEILEIYGEPVERLTAKDDKPLSPDEAKKEDDKLQKIIDKRKNESEQDRRKRLEREEKDREEGRKFVLEVADAFNFRLIGSEVVDGHDTWVLEGDPRPGYEPRQREARMLSKLKGRVWIDKAEGQWVKLDITAIDTISFGFVLARIHKGTRVLVELTHVNDEVWLPKHVQLHFDARVALFKSYDEDVEETYRDYKKFRTDTKITVVGEENREQ